MASHFEVWPGRHYPLGATWDGQGVNFALYSEHATRVEVCLFAEEDPRRELVRLPLTDHTQNVFHGFVPRLRAGALYGFRVYGPWAPERGLRFNPHKLLVDPYARAVLGKPDWNAPLVGHVIKDGRELQDPRDDAHGVPRGVVVHDEFDWHGEIRPEVIWRKAIIYELHVKGFTAQHPGIPPDLRGTYAGLAHPAAIDHLLKLGVTSVELMPVHESMPEGFLQARGLTNHWGYNTLGFFAPDQRFASRKQPGAQVREFKEMVRALHAAGLEVILDVVFNHTCEGNQQGPTLSFRGIDNPTYYWLDESDPSRHRDFTGCGNSMRGSHIQVVKLWMDSLRYWAQEMHVDGFRFDLATTMCRAGQGDFDAHADFLAAAHQDPVISRVKLIAEPWDVGPGGYRLGNFPVVWAEWNDRYRQTVRRFWRGDPGQVADLGYRLTGSSDYFKLSNRRPATSINHVACHDGFTLADVTRYARKHNEGNFEENRDGADDNQSHGWGAEGPTVDPLIEARRDRVLRDLLATLFLSVGTPMITAGDEFGRTQHGNNNTYCHDDPLGWVNWNLGQREKGLLDFTRRCIALRQAHPVLQRRNFFLGETLEDSRFRDLVWFRADGKELEKADWENAELRCVGMFLGGDALATRDPRGRKMTDDTLLTWFNAGAEPALATVPGTAWGATWELVLDTAAPTAPRRDVRAGAALVLPEHSVMVLRLRPVGG